MSNLRILVTGSRRWSDSAAIRTALVSVFTCWPHGRHDPRIQLDAMIKAGGVVLVHGAARGADSIAAEHWRSFGPASLPYLLEPHPADWDRHGKTAGPIRNQQMVELGADVCLAFPLGKSRGTRHCMQLAKDAGIPVLNYGDEEDPS